MSLIQWETNLKFIAKKCTQHDKNMRNYYDLAILRVFGLTWYPLEEVKTTMNFRINTQKNIEKRCGLVPLLKYTSDFCWLDPHICLMEKHDIDYKTLSVLIRVELGHLHMVITKEM